MKAEDNQEDPKAKKKADNLIDFDLSERVLISIMRKALITLNSKIDPTEIFGKSKSKPAQAFKINPNDAFHVKQLYLLPIDLHIDADRQIKIFFKNLT